MVKASSGVSASFRFNRRDDDGKEDASAVLFGDVVSADSCEQRTATVEKSRRRSKEVAAAIERQDNRLLLYVCTYSGKRLAHHRLLLALCTVRPKQEELELKK